MNETSLSHQVRRIMQLVTLLSRPGDYIATELFDEVQRNSEHRRVTLRQIQRDLVTLEASGIIERDDTTKPHRWNIRREHQNILPATFTGNELLSLYVLKSYLVQFRGTAIEVHVNTLLQKLETSAHGDVFSLTLEHSLGQYAHRYDSEILKHVIEAIRLQKPMIITYHSPNNNTTKTYPAQLCRMFTFNGEMYVATFIPKHKSYTALSLRNIHNVGNVCEDIQPHTFNERDFMHNRFGVFLGNPEKIEILIKPMMASFFKSRTWHPSQRFTDKKNGSTVLTMTVPDSPDLHSWILGWAAHIEVLSPKKIRDELHNHYAEMCNLYAQQS